MLRYEVKLGKDNFKQSELVWEEKYLSPDLSYVTGVTDTSYHLEKFKTLPTKNYMVNSDSSLYVEAHNVVRQGFVVASGKTYEIRNGSIIDYSVEKKGEEINYRYVFINGKYFYEKEIENEKVFEIDNLLNYESGRTDDEGNLKEISEYIKVKPTGDFLKIDTVYWIEDNKVLIDGFEYYFDKDESGGIIKFGENGDSLAASAITDCDAFVCHPYKSSNKYKEVTKFKLTKKDEVSEPYSRISFCKYFYYVKYKNHYCEVKKKTDGEKYEFVCEIPEYVLSGDTTSSLAPKEFKLYFAQNTHDDVNFEVYDEARNNGNYVDNVHYDEHRVKDFSDLKNTESFIYVEEDKTYFNVSYDVMNANSGIDIIVYLDNIYSPLKVGEKIEFTDIHRDNHESMIFKSSDYNGSDNEEFAIYNGKKYLIQKNICDKVIINDNEYDIDYVNGKEDNVDCMVLIGDESVPMKIETTNGGDYDNGELKRYGRIVKNISSPSENVIYSIKPYDGIIINGKKYIIYDNSTNDTEIKYASIGLNKKYTFIITNIIGNSTYICRPYINNTDFTDDFDLFISEQICKDVVDNQSTFDLQIKNKVFGEVDITEEIAFRNNPTPTSSDDYFNLFKNLTIYTNSGYIYIPISLKMDVANNGMQEDIVTRDFFETEKKKAINPIVDMEKDVYTPKFVYGYYEDEKHEKIHEYGNEVETMYRGSNTIFKPIYKINLNFHFRTRNLDNWKVNDGYNDLQYSADTRAGTGERAVSGSSDNWFITDFYPYRYILSERMEQSGDTLQETSDLMGLLYFTNDDIFYQRSKVGKSFARVSFYDSTDPQTQSLLATSCIFVDEHALFKKYVDNSRKSLYDYGITREPRYSKNDNGFIEHNAFDTNTKEDITELRKLKKISVQTEFLGSTRNHINYENIEDSLNVVFDENHRVSSRLVVDNKYVTDTSSEGFYIYMFREYAENLRPKPIYMKIEFNHAGIGKTIPFLIPMHWSGNTEDSGTTKYNKMYPDHALKLSNKDDVAELLGGIPLAYTYAQTYIPLYAVYDFEKKEYGYVFDERYIDRETMIEDGILNLNLFEMKIMNESDENINPDTEEGRNLLNDIKLNRPRRAIINVNEKQFNKKSFNYEVE